MTASMLSKRLPGEIFGALISDFARAGGRIEIGEFVRQIIKVGKIPEIAADINRFVQQRQGGLAADSRSIAHRERPAQRQAISIVLFGLCFMA